MPRSSAAARGRGADEIGQAREIIFGFERQRVGLLVGQHVLAERGAERREPLDDRGEALLGEPAQGRRRRA